MRILTNQRGRVEKCVLEGMLLAFLLIKLTVQLADKCKMT